MLLRAVQKRPYDWEPLLSPMLQAYRSTISESTGFTPFRLVFGREMRLPIDFGSPLPEPHRNIRKLAVELTENLEWAYKLARVTIGHGHRRAENRYNKRVFEKLYSPGSLVRVIQHTHPTGVSSKLNPKYSGLCKVLEVRGPILTFCERDTQRIFTANHYSLRASSLSQPDAKTHHASRDLQTSFRGRITMKSMSRTFCRISRWTCLFRCSIQAPIGVAITNQIPRSLRCSIIKSLSHRHL